MVNDEETANSNLEDSFPIGAELFQSQLVISQGEETILGNLSTNSTIFVPTNTALLSLITQDIDFYTTNLDEIISYHIVPDQYLTFEDLVESASDGVVSWLSMKILNIYEAISYNQLSARIHMYKIIG